MKQFNHSKPIQFTSERKLEASRLTELMKTKRPFSFLRLGDLELIFMVTCQNENKYNVEWFDEKKTVSSNIVYGHPGLDVSHYPRLIHAYENCSFLDFHDGWKVNIEHLPKLKLNRHQEALRNSSPQTSQIFFDWLEYEFSGYIKGHRVLLAGGEAGILAELYKDREYHEAFKGFWPENAEVYFLGETRRHKTHLDVIKADLKKFILEHKIDTLFLSMGGGAKIVCYELAVELGICTFDFGGLMRALTYSGSDGYAFYRAVHNPFLFRVPLSSYMKAVKASYPGITPAQLLAKAHAQLALELQTKEKGWSYAAEIYGEDCFNPEGENWSAFQESYTYYKREIFPLTTNDPEAKKQAREFQHWLWERGIGWQSPFYKVYRCLRGGIKKILSR